MVTNTPGVLDESTADFTFALLMASARRIVQADAFVRQGNFKGWEIDMLLGTDVHDATLGIIGMGRIGRGVARRARAFNMRVLYTTPKRAPDVEEQLAVTYVDMNRLLSESDFISLHVPLNKDTHHLIGADQLGQMKPHAIIVNTSRGPVIDEAALVEAVKAHRIGGAGLDVFEREPAIHPGLIALHNVVLAPHIASGTVRTRSEMSAMAARNMATAVRGGRPPNLLNPDVKR
jgi:glyoxylate reductase